MYDNVTISFKPFFLIQIGSVILVGINLDSVISIYTLEQPAPSSLNGIIYSCQNAPNANANINTLFPPRFSTRSIMQQRRIYKHQWYTASSIITSERILTKSNFLSMQQIVQASWLRLPRCLP